MAVDYRTRSDAKAIETMEAKLERKRRVEITRYSRRVTVIQNGYLTVDSGAEMSAIDVFANELEEGASVQMEVSDGQLHADEATVLERLRRRPSFKLRDWLKRRL